MKKTTRNIIRCGTILSAVCCIAMTVFLILVVFGVIQLPNDFNFKWAVSVHLLSFLLGLFGATALINSHD